MSNPNEITIVLLPCPFCGGKAEYWGSSALWGLFCNISVHCTVCCVDTKDFGSNDDAGLFWNTRTKP